MLKDATLQRFLRNLKAHEDSKGVGVAQRKTAPSSARQRNPDIEV